jgi:hypothetical protein
MTLVAAGSTVFVTDVSLIKWSAGGWRASRAYSNGKSPHPWRVSPIAANMHEAAITVLRSARRLLSHRENLLRTIRSSLIGVARALLASDASAASMPRSRRYSVKAMRAHSAANVAPARFTKWGSPDIRESQTPAATMRVATAEKENQYLK